MTTLQRAGLTTIIPAKPFEVSKTRLSPILSPAQRADLSRALLARTIGLAAQLTTVLVVSRSQAVRRLARQAGAQALPEQQPGLNAAVSQGVIQAQTDGAIGVLILPLDLPQLTLADLEAMLTLGRQTRPGLAIAPCHRRRGSNALFMSPPALIAPRFGPDSFAAHLAAARSIGLTPRVYHSPSLAFDLDLPEDWQRVRRLYDSLLDKPNRKSKTALAGRDKRHIV